MSTEKDDGMQYVVQTCRHLKTRFTGAISSILTHLAYRANAKKRAISNNIDTVLKARGNFLKIFWHLLRKV